MSTTPIALVVALATVLQMGLSGALLYAMLVGSLDGNLPLGLMRLFLIALLVGVNLHLARWLLRLADQMAGHHEQEST